MFHELISSDLHLHQLYYVRHVIMYIWNILQLYHTPLATPNDISWYNMIFTLANILQITWHLWYKWYNNYDILHVNN